MLTPNLVRARQKDGKLLLTRWSKADRERALELSETLMAIAAEHVGKSREELQNSWLDVPHVPREERLLNGLQKLLEDRAEFSAETRVPASEVRSELFLRASEERAQSGVEFVREALIDRVAAHFSLSAEELEQGLYADLRSAHLLRRVDSIAPAALLEAYDVAAVQAVLLRAVKVRIRLFCQTPQAYRAFFRKLKFRRLLYSLFREGDGYRLEIDGPFSLFESVTKYGLQLALLIPALSDCDRVELEAEVRWGKRRDSLLFEWQQEGPGSLSGSGQDVSEEVAQVLQAFEKRPLWAARPSDTIVDVPGAGVCVPDIEFRHEPTGRRVYLEILGYWSRDAVWRRIELAETGLKERLLFSVSERLRVSQDLLDDCESAALYVYKGVMSPAAIERRLVELVAR